MHMNMHMPMVHVQGIDETLSYDSTRVDGFRKIIVLQLAPIGLRKRYHSTTIQTTQCNSKYGQVTGTKLCNYNQADSILHYRTLLAKNASPLLRPPSSVARMLSF